MPEVVTINDEMTLDEFFSLFKRYNTGDGFTWSGVKHTMKKIKREQLIKDVHPYSITSSKDGKYRTYVKDETRNNGRRQIVRNKRKDLIDFLYNYYECSVVTIESLFDEWINYKSLKVEETTIIRIKYDYKRYYEHSDIVKIPLQELTTLDLDKWIHKLIKDQYPTRHQYMNCTLIIRQILEYAFQKGG